MSLIDDMNRNDTNLIDGVASLQQMNRATVESIKKATQMSVIKEIPYLVGFLTGLVNVVELNDTVVDRLKQEALIHSEQLKVIIDLVEAIERKHS